MNDARSPLVPFVTRPQLWRGLVLRAEEPQLFVPQLSEATILARSDSGLVRALRYGDALVTDEVSFVALVHVRYDIAAQGEISRSSLTMSIEEPRPGALFVRFVYVDETGASARHGAHQFPQKSMRTTPSFSRAASKPGRSIAVVMVATSCA